MECVPAKAEEPKRLRPKRAPSSSAQSTSRIVTGGLPLKLLRRSAAALPAPPAHPAQPSSQPPFGTESRCPPSSSAFWRFARQRHPVISGRIVVMLDRQVAPVWFRTSPALSARYPSRRHAARRSHRRSARAVLSVPQRLVSDREACVKNTPARASTAFPVRGRPQTCHPAPALCRAPSPRRASFNLHSLKTVVVVIDMLRLG